MSNWLGPPLCASDTVATIGELVIEGESGDPISMHIDGCWNCIDPTVLWVPLGVRGENVIIASNPGRYPEPWRLDQSIYDILMVIDGTNDWDGNPYDNHYEGLETNEAYLIEELVIPPADITTTTRPCELTMPSGLVRSGGVQPRSVQHQFTALGTINLTITLVVTDGRLVVEAS